MGDTQDGLYATSFVNLTGWTKHSLAPVTRITLSGSPPYEQVNTFGGTGNSDNAMISRSINSVYTSQAYKFQSMIKNGAIPFPSSANPYQTTGDEWEKVVGLTFPNVNGKQVRVLFRLKYNGSNFVGTIDVIYYNGSTWVRNEDDSYIIPGGSAPDSAFDEYYFEIWYEPDPTDPTKRIWKYRWWITLNGGGGVSPRSGDLTMPDDSLDDLPQEAFMGIGNVEAGDYDYCFATDNTPLVWPTPGPINFGFDYYRFRSYYEDKTYDIPEKELLLKAVI